MSSSLTLQRAILARLGLDTLRSVAEDYYPPAYRDYNMMMIGFFITQQVSRGLQPPTASRIARGLQIPRTTVTRLLQRMEKIGVVGRVDNGYYPTNSPTTDAGAQHRVSLVLRAAKELTETGHQNPSSDGQQQTPPVRNAPTGALNY